MAGNLTRRFIRVIFLLMTMLLMLLCVHTEALACNMRKLAIHLVTVILLNKTLVPSNLRSRMYVKEEFEGTDRFRE